MGCTLFPVQTFSLQKLKLWGTPSLGREGLCHFSMHPSTAAREHQQLLQQRCEHGPWLGTGFLMLCCSLLLAFLQEIPFLIKSEG